MSQIYHPINNISEVTEPLKEQIIKGDIHTIDEMRAWLQGFGYSDAIKDAAVNAILREFVMSKVSCESLINAPTITTAIRHRYLPCDASWHPLGFAACYRRDARTTWTTSPYC